MTRKGHCLCQKVSYEFEGDMIWQCYCHCDDCRRNCAAPVVAWFGVALKQFKWTGDAPQSYNSSEGVYRHFCGTCGSPIAFEADHYQGGMQLYAASLENPSDFAPNFHVNYDSKLAWLTLEDEHERYNTTLAQSDKDLSAYE